MIRTLISCTSCYAFFSWDDGTDLTWGVECRQVNSMIGVYGLRILHNGWIMGEFLSLLMLVVG